MSGRPAWFGAAQIAAVAGSYAVDALERVLLDGLDPALDIARTSAPLGAAGGGGEFLLMPSTASVWTGIKIITVAPGNAGLDLPRIQGVYALFDSASLTPVAVMDGAALTALRTPAVSMLVVRRRLATATAPVRVAVFGTGPQAVRHALAVVELADAPGGPGVADLALVSRRPHAVDLPGIPHAVRIVSTESAADVIAAADLVIAATTARAPLFDGSLVADGAVVVAVGSHEPDARELDSALLARAQVVVEDPATALREAGDVVIPVAEGALDPASLVPIAAVVRGDVALAADRPVVFKTTGMAWQDLAIAGVVVERGAPAAD